MWGRPLTGSKANIFDTSIFIRNNKSEYDVFLYGFNKSTHIEPDADILMTLHANLDLQLLFFLQYNDINISLEMKELALEISKYLETEVPIVIGIDGNMTFKIDKYLTEDIINTIEAKISITLDKIIAVNESISMSANLGNFNNPSSPLFGLRFRIVRPFYISNIQNMTIADLCADNAVIEDICFVNIE